MSVEHVEYYWGMFESADAAEPAGARAHVRFSGPGIPEAVATSFKEERINELTGDYGFPGAGDPEQVDVLTYVASGHEQTVRVMNRAIALFNSDDEEIKRLHRFFHTVEKEAKED
jgi:hypothetical protein